MEEKKCIERNKIRTEKKALVKLKNIRQLNNVIFGRMKRRDNVVVAATELK